jgi:hypothetical protein
MIRGGAQPSADPGREHESRNTGKSFRTKLDKRKVFNTVVAFANGGGGTIVFGVEDVAFSSFMFSLAAARSTRSFWTETSPSTASGGRARRTTRARTPCRDCGAMRAERRGLDDRRPRRTDPDPRLGLLSILAARRPPGVGESGPRTRLGHTEIRAEVRPDGESEEAQRAAENVVRSPTEPLRGGDRRRRDARPRVDRGRRRALPASPRG